MSTHTPTYIHYVQCSHTYKYWEILYSDHAQENQVVAAPTPSASVFIACRRMLFKVIYILIYYISDKTCDKIHYNVVSFQHDHAFDRIALMRPVVFSNEFTCTTDAEVCCVKIIVISFVIYTVNV